MANKNISYARFESRFTSYCIAEFREKHLSNALEYLYSDVQTFWASNALPERNYRILFLLPTGRPRRLVVGSEISAFANVIHDGGRPRRFPRPRRRRSILRITSSSCARSCRNSSNILLISNGHPPDRSET
jgi:hypothetical protein